VDDRVTSLHQNMSALLAGSETRQQLEAVVAVSHALALTHLRGKGSAWRMMDFHGLAHSDLAYDCVGDLFRRDENGALIELQTYFKDLEIARADAAEVLVHLRRLVFAKVNRNLSRLIAETDSLYFRTARNLRNALATTGRFEEKDRFGEPVLVPPGCDLLLHLPFHSEPELAQLVWGTHSLSANAPAFVERLHDAVCAQSNRCRMIPLLPLVALIKDVTEKQHLHEERLSRSDELSEDAVREIVATAGQETHRKFHKAYVAKGKVTPDDFIAYLKAIESVLLVRISTDDGHNESLYTFLKRHMCGLTEEQYREKHRARVEYMARYMHERVAEHLK
jgi:hypothetical protein